MKIALGRCGSDNSKRQITIDPIFDTKRDRRLPVDNFVDNPVDNLCLSCVYLVDKIAIVFIHRFIHRLSTDRTLLFVN